MPNSKALRLVAVCAMKDEEWLVERWLRRTSEFADGIVVLDDGSTDRTKDIVRACPKVVELMENPPGGSWLVLKNRQRLLDAARRHGAEWVMVLDADEIMDARLADRLEDLIGRPELGRIFFREVTLWRSNQYYRIDKPEMYHRDTGTNQMLRMTPDLRWERAWPYTFKPRLKKFLTTGHFPPAPVSGYETLRGIRGETLKVADLVRVHYHFADWERTWSGHVRYAARDAIQFKRKLHELESIVDWATARLDETGLELEPVKLEWGVL